jgi:hypothetical protein
MQDMMELLEEENMLLKNQIQMLQTAESEQMADTAVDATDASVTVDPYL